MRVWAGRNLREAQTEGEMQAVSDTEANLKSFCKYVLTKRETRAVLSWLKGRACRQMVPGKPVCNGLLQSLHSCCQMPIIFIPVAKEKNAMCRN